MDHEQIVKILLSHRSRLTAYLWSIVRDNHEADDLFQDLCLRAIRESDRFNDEEHLLKWSTRAARDRAIDQLRSARRNVKTLDAAVLATLESEWHDPNVPTDDVTEALDHCLGQLPDKSRALLDQKYRDGLAGLDIAKATGRKRDAVYKSITRLHAVLYDCITGRLQGNVGDGDD